MSAGLNIAELRRSLESVAQPERAGQMSAYLRDQFPFLGLQSRDRRTAARPTLAAAKHAPPDELMAFAQACWAEPEREFAYVACDVLGKHAVRLRAGLLPEVSGLITTKSWWDTIDPLAAHTVGTMVRTHPELVATMDRWIDSENFWLARAAILHQLFSREATDTRRLFAYATKRAGDTEFFIRKAIGWSLRQYARTDPQAVRAFVAAHESELSGLTTREAMKHLTP